MRSGEYLFQRLFSRKRIASLTKAAAGLAVVVVVVIQASVPKIYPKVALASASTLVEWRRSSKYILPGCIEPGTPL